MIEIVTANEFHLYSEYLEEMHRQRYRVLVQEAGWNIPNCEPGYDKDKYDNEDAVYLLYIDPVTRELIASVRLISTLKPHLMADTFSKHCEIEGVPRSADVVEATRYVFDRPKIASDDFPHVRMRLPLAMTEYCLQNGIRAVAWLTHRHLHEGSKPYWNSKPLGDAKYYASDNAHYIASLAEMSVDAAMKLRNAIGEKRPVLFQRRAVPVPAEALTAAA